ncbi:hypothetical protein [Colwellia sp. PAMC 20917]|uniref:hypothetical protein n=1 Tax=Colwellia sp. PAMC 20917 TaxID=1816218 RepID=UPI0012F7A038|nr:hypothetical protein [Colwellia sp. PAMC 20917]
MLSQHNDMLAQQAGMLLQHNGMAVFNNCSAKLKTRHPEHPRHPELVSGSHYFKPLIQILK